MVSGNSSSSATARRLETKTLRIGEAGSGGSLIEVQEHPIFQSIRKLYGVKDTFLHSIDLQKIVRDSGGAHAQLVFTDDGDFIVKVCKSGDWNVLEEILEDYHNHLRKHAHISLMPRFFSAFETDGKKWVAMFNWIRKGFTDSTRTYDLKGTTCSVESGDRLVRVELSHDKVPTLKDLNWAQNEEQIHLPVSVRDDILKAVVLDTGFLEEKGLMDYSLIISVGRAGVCNARALENVCPKKSGPLYQTIYQRENGYSVGITKADGVMYVYSFGLIDILESYGKVKSAANWYKSIKCGANEIRDTVNVKTYKDRFDEMMQRITIADSWALEDQDCRGHRKTSSEKATLLNLGGAHELPVMQRQPAIITSALRRLETDRPQSYGDCAGGSPWSYGQASWVTPTIATLSALILLLAMLALRMYQRLQKEEADSPFAEAKLNAAAAEANPFGVAATIQLEQLEMRAPSSSNPLSNTPDQYTQQSGNFDRGNSVRLSAQQGWQPGSLAPTSEIHSLGQHSPRQTPYQTSGAPSSQGAAYLGGHPSSQNVSYQAPTSMPGYAYAPPASSPGVLEGRLHPAW